MNISVNWLRTALIALTVTAAWGAVTRGIDYTNYQKWTRAILTADITKIGNSESLSPYGVPYFHWSAGPALVAAPLSWTMHGTQFQYQAELAVGFVCVLAFWRLFYKGLVELNGRSNALWGCLVAMSATSLGYYSLNISSESMTLAPAGALFLESARWVKGKTVRWYLVVMATCMLAMIRPQQAVYALPALLICGAELRYSSWKETVGKLACTGLMFAFTVWQIGTVNRWMTGSFWRTPYTFGDDSFRSFDQSCPHLFQILFDSFHGFVPTTPIVILGFVSALVLLMAPGLLRLKIVLFLGLFAIAVNVYVQGCWYYWWLAGGFGMRGLVLANIYLIAALGVAVRNIKIRARNSVVARRTKWLIVAFIAVCMVWSWLLTKDERTPTWAAIGSVFVNEVIRWTHPQRLLILAAGSLIGTMTAWALGFKRTGLIGNLSLCLIWICLAEQSVDSPSEPFVAWGIFAVMVIVVARNLEARFNVWPELLMFSTVTALLAFIPIAWRAENLRKTSEVAVTFNHADLWNGYLTAKSIPSLKEEAHQMREFLMRQKGSKWVIERETED